MSEPPKPKPTRIAELVFWNSRMITRRAEQAETDREHAGDAAGAEGDLERGGERAGLGGSGGAHVATGGERHADVAGETGEQGAGDEGQRAERSRIAPTSARRHRPA